MKTSSQSTASATGPMSTTTDLIRNEKKMGDISGYTALTYLLLCCLSIPCSVYWFNPSYLSSTTGYADGGDMYSHIAEALHLKELFQNGSLNFWYDKATLGYPMFTAYHPLPCFFTALTMLLFERLVSPLLVFRLLFTLILTLTPLSWYISGKSFGFSRLQSICLAVLTFSIQSWRMFGLEMDAYSEYGLYTQSYGFLLLPLTVSSIFNHIYQEKNMEQSSTPILLLSTTLLSHFFFGLYVYILSGVLFVTYVITHASSLGIREFTRTFMRFFYIHLKALVLISWWIIGCLVSYPYVGGLPWRNESEDGYRSTFVIGQFWNGKFFDNGRSIPWFTFLAVTGFTLALGTVIHDRIKYMLLQPMSRMFSIWILFSCVITLLLFLGRTTFGMVYNIIPFHTEMECVKYLSGIHFCGLLLASFGLAELILWSSNIVVSIIRIPLSYYSIRPETDVSDASVTFSRLLFKIHLLWKVTMDWTLSRIGGLLRGLFLALAVAGLLFSQSYTIASKLTVSEVNPRLQSELIDLQNAPFEGRILTHKALGTAGPWHLAFIPKLSNKPVLMTYSRGYHDSLSVYYLEYIAFSAARAEQFKALLRLYNIHYLISRGIRLYETFVKECQIKHIKSIDGIDFYQMMSEMNDYGYFDFVNIPGHIQGDLKAMRETVLETLDFYTANKLLLINPKTFRHRSYVSIKVKKRSFLQTVLNSNIKDDVFVTWKFKDEEMESQEVISRIIGSTGDQWMYSQVIEEKSYQTEYHAVVQVADKGKESDGDDYMLLKVTYHPFWKSYYFPVEEDFTLDQFNPKLYPKGKTYTKVHHVTPNLMSITLPPGRYCVVFRYQYPGILKILAGLSIIACIYMMTTSFRRNHSIVLENKDSVDQNGVAKTWKLPGKYRVHSIIAKERFSHEAERSVYEGRKSMTVPAMRRCTMLGSVETNTLEDWMSQIERTNTSTLSKSTDARFSAALQPAEIDQIEMRDTVLFPSVKRSRDNVFVSASTNSNQALDCYNAPEVEVVLSREFLSNSTDESNVDDLANQETDNYHTHRDSIQIDPVSEYTVECDFKEASVLSSSSDSCADESTHVDSPNDVIYKALNIDKNRYLEIIEQLKGIKSFEYSDKPSSFKRRETVPGDFVNPEDRAHLARFRRLSQWY